MRIALAVLLLSALACANATPTPTLTPQMDAWWNCLTFIQTKLGIDPQTAQDLNPAGIVNVGSNWTVTVFYPKNSAIYQCKMENRDGQLVLLQINLMVR